MKSPMTIVAMWMKKPPRVQRFVWCVVRIGTDFSEADGVSAYWGTAAFRLSLCC